MIAIVQSLAKVPTLAGRKRGAGTCQTRDRAFFPPTPLSSRDIFTDHLVRRESPAPNPDAAPISSSSSSTPPLLLRSNASGGRRIELGENFPLRRSKTKPKKMSEGERFQLGTVGALSLSVVSSVSIVICNKALISTLHFTFGEILPPLSSNGFNFVFFLLLRSRGLRLEQVPSLLKSSDVAVNSFSIACPQDGLERNFFSASRATTLTSWHLLVTFCSLHAALWMKLFEHKPFDPRAVMGFGVLNGISIGLLNLSLGFNSVGFYQMTKLAIIPCTVLIETLRNVQLSLTILLIGVGIATVTDMQLNVLGSVLSLLAVITTCVAQILYLVGLMFFIVLSCLISVSVNFSTFLVIGKTSPVTYQVLGHLKTCLVLTFGYVLLHDPFSWRNICGILVAIVGMILYSYFCANENQQKAAEASAQLSQAKEAEDDPLLSVENGTAVVADGVVGPKAQGWAASDKDLHA
ncbi:hypothetical protein ACLOJK_031441 [Asimina triloba]